jgi:hypothetical protein
MEKPVGTTGDPVERPSVNTVLTAQVASRRWNLTESVRVFSP